MNMFTLLVGFILTFSILTFIVLFGHIPSLKRTPVGWTHTLLFQSLPNAFKDLDRKITNGLLTRKMSRWSHRLINDRHPLVMIMYCSLFLGGVSIFMFRGVFTELSQVHSFIVPCLTGLPLWTLYLAAMTDPGYISAQNHSPYMTEYEFDQVLFRRGHECHTCKREKPARSKHCGLCNKCIAKHDHHCIWINSCVGERNMKWFLAFLASNVVTFTYATIILYAHFRKLLQNVKEDDAATTFLQLWLSLLRTDVLVGSLFLFAGMCDILVTFFLVYHSYLVFSGVTTNETLKFEDIKQAIEARELDLYQRGPDQFYLDLAGKPGRVTWKELENIYDKGWKNNLRSILQSRA